MNDKIPVNSIGDKNQLDITALIKSCESHEIDGAIFDEKNGWSVPVEVIEKYLNGAISCRLCNEIEDRNFVIRTKLNISSTILYKNEHWIVLPALGSVVPGYVMIVNKEHFNSIATCPPEQYDLLEKTIDVVKGAIKKVYNSNCILFEHGVLSNDMVGSNSVDHVHLHVLPFEKDLSFTFIHYINMYERISTFNDLNKLANNYNMAYLFYENFDGKRFYIKDKDAFFPPQFFRRQIAALVDRCDEWNWKTHPNYDEFLQTYNSLKKQFD